MHEERLRQLRRVVENAPDERFHMGEFCTRRPRGTALCAAGHAAIDGWFQTNTEILEIFDVGENAKGIINVDSISGNTFGKLAILFGLDNDETDRLFGGNLKFFETATKEDVLANIDRLLNGEPTRPYTPIRKER